MWQKRLGHPSNNALFPIKNILGVSTSQNNCNNHYSVCPFTKHKQLPLESLNNMCDDTFSLAHCDIWGPYQQTHTGHKCFAIIVDDKSRNTWIYLLKHNSDIQDIIPKFYMYIKTQFNKSIKSLRTDNAKELELKAFFCQKGNNSSMILCC